MAPPRAALVLFLCFLPLISVSTYEIRTLEPCYDNTIWLGSNDKSALNFSLGNLKYSQRSSYSDFKCAFRIEAEEGYQIIAVIQKMNLRGNPKGPCLDYIEFTDPPKLAIMDIYLRHKNAKGQFCGNTNVSTMSWQNDIVLPAFDSRTMSKNVYFVNGKELKVKVFISKAQLRPEETLDFQVIFTAARTGSECRDKIEFDCGNRTCIWRGFYKDNFVNCPYVNCPDEEGCEGPPIKYSSGTGTTIIICAVVSMISVLGVFLFCLLICRRCKVLCWASRPPTTRDPASRIQISSSHPSDAVQPSAPPLIAIHDKDLPPSYDSLFPSRTAEAGVSLGTDNGIERYRRSRNFPFVRKHNGRVEGGTMRYYRRKPNVHNSGSNENLNRSESSCVYEPSRGRGGRNGRRPSNRGRGHTSTRHSDNIGLGRNQNPNRGAPRHNSRHGHRGRKSRGFPNQTGRNYSHQRGRPRHNHNRARRRTQSLNATHNRSREWVHPRRNTEGSDQKWYDCLWEVCCL